MKNSSLFKPLFWFGVSVAMLIALFTILLAPVIGMLLLLLLALAFVLLIFFFPSLWQVVKPAQKKKEAPVVPVASRLKQPEMLLESCSSDYENIVINKPMFVIGRAADNDYVFRNTNGIGFHHCRITYRETTRQFFIEDLDSKCGTYLNGRRLNSNTPVPLQKNSIVAFHVHRYLFKPVV